MAVLVIVDSTVVVAEAGLFDLVAIVAAVSVVAGQTVLRIM